MDWEEAVCRERDLDGPYCRCDVCWSPPSWAWPVSDKKKAAFPADPGEPYLLCDDCQRIVISGDDVVPRLVRRLQAGQPVTVQFGPWMVTNRESDEDDADFVRDLLEGRRGDYSAFG